MEPKIRFKGFEGEWKASKIGDISTSYSGGTPPVGVSEFYGGDIPFIRSGEIHENKTELFLTEEGLNNSSAKIVEKGTLLYALYGATSGEVGISKIKGAINQAILAITPNKTVEKKFLSNFLQLYKKKIVSDFLQGGQGNLSGAIVKSILITYPDNIAEQQAIGNYFTSLDKQITASTSRLASLKQMKAASLQSMFPQNGESMPKVRFKGFEGEWRRIKFGTISSRITRRNNTLECKLPLTISANEGLISQEKFFKNIVASSNLGNYYLLKRGEFAYNKSYSNGYPFGAIKRLDKYDSGVLSPLYICFGIHDEVDSDYICFFFETTLWHKDVAERATEGARNHGILNIGTEDFFDIDIMIPESKEEQQSIATFFRSLDRKIALETARLEKLKQIKLACLDKMFV